MRPFLFRCLSDLFKLQQHTWWEVEVLRGLITQLFFSFEREQERKKVLVFSKFPLLTECFAALARLVPLLSIFYKGRISLSFGIGF